MSSDPRLARVPPHSDQTHSMAARLVGGRAPQTRLEIVLTRAIVRGSSGPNVVPINVAATKGG